MSDPEKLQSSIFSGSVTARDQFFNDGKRQIDYMLVYDKNKRSATRDVYLDALQMAKLELEYVSGLAEQHIVFVKVHAPTSVLMNYANLYDIPVKKQQVIFLQPPRPRFKCMRTELTNQDPTTPNYMRAKETFAYAKPTMLLSYERSMIVYNILKRTDFGIRDFESGIDRLLRQEVFLSAFPLHDGQSKWNDDLNEPLNDRQLLRRYWSCLRVLFKKQPLDVVERYFGVTIAMYFSFSSFYNKMLIFPTILGLSVFIINLSRYKSKRINPVCASKLIICPICSSCNTLTLSDYCGSIKLHAISDSIYTIIYSIVITFWDSNGKQLFIIAAVFLALWKRRQAILGLRWNITDSKFEEQDIRTEFENVAKGRLSEIGELEMYIPWYSLVWRYTLACIIVLLVCILVVVVLASIAVFDITISNKIQNNWVSTILSVLLTVVAILGMRRGYNNLIEWVVNLEVPKTQTDFYNSYILKVFLVSFVNNYGTIIYLAYFKRFIYTYPGDPQMYSKTAYYLVNTCGPLGCYFEVNILLEIIMVLLPNLNELVNVCKLKYRIWREGNKLVKAHLQHHDIPRWEKDYELFHMDPIEQITQYEQIVIQFGYVTLFSVAFPIAPFLALVSNLIKTHRDADYFITKCRRPLAGRTENIGIWLDIMKFLMFASVVTNAFFIAFTTHTIEQYIYNPDAFHSMVEYIQTVFLSSYHLNKNHYPGANVPNGTQCWYPKHNNDVQVFVYKDGESWRYYGNNDEEATKLYNKEYKDNVTQEIIEYGKPSTYKNVTFPHVYGKKISINKKDILNFKFRSVLWYQNCVMFITMLINYAIPDIPLSVTQKYADFTMNSRKTQNTRFSSSYISL